MRIDTKYLDEFLGRSENFFSLYITFQVMAVADVSTGDKDTVGPALEPFQDKVGVNPAGAHDSHNAQGRRVLKPADASQIRC